MPSILVLDDMEDRVQFLKEQVPDSTTIIWVTNFDDFREVMHLPHDLAIFDHDLTEAHYSDTPTPEPTGADAAHIYPKNSASALVWSRNPEGAAHIAQILSKKGIPTITIPFHYAETLSRFLKDFVESV